MYPLASVIINDSQIDKGVESPSISVCVVSLGRVESVSCFVHKRMAIPIVNDMFVTFGLR